MGSHDESYMTDPLLVSPSIGYSSFLRCLMRHSLLMRTDALLYVV